jgi:hypothetical protein
MSTIAAVQERSPLERARDRLHQSAGTAQACYDDMVAPSWASFRSSRTRFLDRPAPRRGVAEAQGGTAQHAR